MRVLAVVLALGALPAAATLYAQAPAPATQKPTTPAPASRPQSQTPAAPSQPAPRPAQQPATPPPAGAVAPAPPALPPPFAGGFKIGYVNLQRVAAESADGKKAAIEINNLTEKWQAQINEKQKTMQTAQQTLESQAGVLNDARRQQLQTEIERTQRDLQRLAEDAEQDVQRLTQRLEQEFRVRLSPVIDQIAKEKDVELIFNAGESGLIYAKPGMEMTTDVIKALDATAGAKPAAAALAAPAAPPAK